MSKHTPTPWILGDDEDSSRYLVGPATFPGIVTNPVVQLHDEANAEFIVRACNAHEHAESVCEWISHCFDDPSVNFIPSHIAADAREFLEKAKAVQS